MKKIVLCSVCGLLALTMVGCGSASQDNAIKNLSSQLDRVTNTVSSMSTSQYTSLVPTSYNANNYMRTSSEKTYNQNGYVGSQMAKMEASAEEQESLRNIILEKSATLKTELKQKLKLNKEQIKALNGLTSGISKYTNNLNMTKNDINNAVKMIRKNSGTNNYRTEGLGAYYQNLNNHLDARLCYFRNLLNSMEQVSNIVNCPTCENEQTTTQENNNTRTPNIDTYAPKEVSQNVNNNVNNNGYNPNYNNYSNNNYNYGNYPNNGYNYGNYPYNGYNYNRVFNPNRNTDTYQPRVRNIDTYRTYPNNNYYNGMNTPINNGEMPAANMQSAPIANEKVEEVKTLPNEEVKTQEVENTTAEKEEVKTSDQNNDAKIIRSSINRQINKTQTKNYEPASKSSTQEVRDYRINRLRPTSRNASMMAVDHAQTNKKIEKLIRG